MPTLASFEREEDITEFVRVKVESIIVQDVDANVQDVIEGSGDSSHFRAQAQKFTELFGLPEEDKLVNCKLICVLTPVVDSLCVDYSCSYWKGGLPRQGWMCVRTCCRCD